MRKIKCIDLGIDEVTADIIQRDSYGQIIGIDYQRLSTALIDTIKELKSENAKLKRRLETLERL